MAKDAAFLLVSFGGPEGPEDVMPFLRNVTVGRNIPEARLAHVAEHYYHFGGVSPINVLNRELLGAIERDFSASGIDLPVYWGNRNWRPLLADTMRVMADDGVRSVIAFVTAAYSSYSSCRQYLEDIDRARAVVGASAPSVIKIPPYYGHRGFAASFIGATSRAIASLPPDVREEAELVFTAHSIPESMAAVSGPDGGAYQAQLAEVAGRVAAGAGRTSWQLAYQSRSGPPSVPWLGPDISDCLIGLAKAGTPAVVVVPIGFISDHMEVIFDLDVEAARTAADLGLPMARAATPGTDPVFVALISSLVRDFAAGARGDAIVDSWKRALGPSTARLCVTRCCRAGS
ncbi:MAG: ferrochelatase [Streptosporangiaceae bacterium]